MPVVDIKQDTQDVCEIYLFILLINLCSCSKNTKANFDAWVLLVLPPVKETCVSDDTYKSSLNYYYITKETIQVNFVM